MDSSAVALVVGSSRGLGLLIARELLDREFRVVIVARDAGELSEAESILTHHGVVETRVCDVADAERVQQLVDEVERNLGPITVAVTVAGVIQVGPAEAMTLDHFRDAISIMTYGPVHVAWAVLPRMRERRRGHIGTVTSVGGMVSPPHLLPYATAKFGAVGFSDGLAAELAGTGVTATTIVPGLMRTGSHERAYFTGDQPKEYAWFATAASAPVLSMDAERAARKIVDGVLAGRAMVVLTPLAWLGIRVRGLAPATTTRLMGVVARRLLPAADSAASPATVEGKTAARRADSKIISVLTTLGSRAASRFNERSGSRSSLP